MGKANGVKIEKVAELSQASPTIGQAHTKMTYFYSDRIYLYLLFTVPWCAPYYLYM